MAVIKCKNEKVQNSNGYNMHNMHHAPAC